MKYKLSIFLFLCLPFSMFSQIEPGDEIIGQVVQSIENQYYDTTYNGKNWLKIQQEIFEISQKYSLQPTELVDSLLIKMNDPFVRVFTPKQFISINTELRTSEHIGIGLTEMFTVDIDYETRAVEILAPLKNSPAEKANLQPNDIIIAINKTPVDGLFLEDVVGLMRLKEGEKVRLKINRNGKMKKVKLKTTVVEQSLEPYFKVVEHDEKKIGCIWFPQFTNASAPQFQDIIQQFQEKKVDGILLDLRNNPGGLLQEAQRIGGFCMGNGAMGKTEGKSNYLSVLPTLEEKITDLPMVVLTNKGTASAAELLAGSLQYEKRAIIIGETTAGKGFIYTFIPLSEGYILTLPVGRIRLLNGRDLLTEGIEPDILIKNETPFRFGAMKKDEQFLKGLEQLTMEN
jgi:carboxyl-terminal processing protease